MRTGAFLYDNPFMRNRIVLIAILAAGLLIYFYVTPYTEGIAVGDPAPAFELTDQQGKLVKLSDLRGQTILLNIWATWCPPCVWEMPSLERLHLALAQDNFKVVAVSIDEGGWPVIRQFLQRTSLSFPILLDSSTAVAQSYGTYQLPESYIIGPQGKILKKYRGPREWDKESVVNEIQALIRKHSNVP